MESTSRFALRHAPLAVACVLTIVLGLTAGQANAGTATRAGDWWQPGFDAGHTKFNPEPSDLTPFHVRHLQRVWSHHSPFFVPAAPAVVGNRLFIAGRNEDDSGAISELAASTGRLRWTRSQSCAAGPLSVVQDVLVVGDDCPTVAVGHSALSGARPYGGKLLWVSSGSADTTTVAHKALFSVHFGDPNFGEGDAVVRLDPRTGDVVWNFGGHRVGDAFSGTAVVRRRVYATTPGGTLYEIGARSGKLHWSMPDAGSSPPVVSNGVAYLSDNKHVRAIDLSARSVLWSAPSADFGSQVIAVGNAEVFDDRNTRLTAYDGATGEVLWHHTHRTSYRGLVVSNGVVYAEEGSFRRPRVGIFSASTGEELHAPVPGLGAIVSHGLLYIWTGRSVRAYSCPCP